MQGRASNARILIVPCHRLLPINPLVDRATKRANRLIWMSCGVISIASSPVCLAVAVNHRADRVPATVCSPRK